jgi:small subunit ribosomal protein S9
MYLANSVGRRKTSVARVFAKKGKGVILVNKLPIEEYFKIERLVKTIKVPLIITDKGDKFDLVVNVIGGGFNSQAEAVRHGISRVICKLDDTARPILKTKKLLTRDSRMVERKKPGRVKARKKTQFSKR